MVYWIKVGGLLVPSRVNLGAL